MNQKGFVIILITGLVIFASGASYLIVKWRVLSMALTPSPAPTRTLNQIRSPISRPAPIHETSLLQIMAPVINNIFSVVELLSNKEHYLGTQVRVRGRIVLNIFYSGRPCPTEDSVCDTTMGAQLELWEPQPTPGTENKVLIFRNGKPYPCEKIAPEQYRCGAYINGELLIVNGIWSKDQVPDQVVGYSSGEPPTVLKWKDRYFLEIK